MATTTQPPNDLHCSRCKKPHPLIYFSTAQHGVAPRNRKCLGYECDLRLTQDRFLNLTRLQGFISQRSHIMNDEIDYVVFDQVTGQLLKTGLAEDCDKEHIWDTNLHRGRILLCIERRDSPRGLQLNVVLRQTVTLFTLYKTETITMQMIEDVLTNNWAAHFCPHSLRAGRARSIFPVGLEKASWNLSFPSQGAPFHIWHCPHEGCKSQLRLLYKKQEYLVGDRGLDEFVDVKVQSVRNLGTLEDALDGMWLSQLELPVGSPF